MNSYLSSFKFKSLNFYVLIVINEPEEFKTNVKKKKNIKKFFRNKKIFLIILSISLLIGIGTVEFLTYNEKVVPVDPNKIFYSENITISYNVTKSTVYFDIIPSYFASEGKLYAFYYSPYDAYFNYTKFYMSIDGNRWKEIYYYSSMPDTKHFDSYTYVGYIDLRKPESQLYTERLFPPKENIILPPNTTHDDLLKSMKVYLLLKKESTQYDKIIQFFSIIALSSFIFTVLSSYVNWDKK